ncbi:hypothetical protein [Photorhabdus sp. RM323S]|uniref:hypothetical protein n=1 Tax=Photorhabdus sp. RM323S TaxID=3342828 RepID=UPI0036DC8832
MRYIYSITLDAMIASFLFIGITQMFGRDTLVKEYKHVPTTFLYYDLLTDTAFVIFVVYQGWFVLGAIYATGAMAKVEFQGKQEKLLKY